MLCRIVEQLKCDLEKANSRILKLEEEKDKLSEKFLGLEANKASSSVNCAELIQKKSERVPLKQEELQVAIRVAQKDNEKRETRVIIFGIEESEKNEGSERAKDDDIKVKEIFKVMNVHESTIKKIWRLKNKKSNQDETEDKKKTRPSLGRTREQVRCQTNINSS